MLLESLRRGGRGIEIGCVGDDDDPAAVALGHHEIGVACAVGPIGTVALAGAGHRPVIVHYSEFGAEVSDRQVSSWRPPSRWQMAFERRLPMRSLTCFAT